MVSHEPEHLLRKYRHPDLHHAITEAFRIAHEEAGLIPLHQQSLIWGVSKKVKIAQRADNQILFYWATLE